MSARTWGQLESLPSHHDHLLTGKSPGVKTSFLSIQKRSKILKIFHTCELGKTIRLPRSETGTTELIFFLWLPRTHRQRPGGKADDSDLKKGGGMFSKFGGAKKEEKKTPEPKKQNWWTL